MDSKLVIEQMAGRWKIKHPDMRPLAVRAQSLAPLGTEWTWVPRAENSAADALANMALDGKPIPPKPLVALPDQAVPKEPSDLQKAVQGWGAAVDRAAHPVIILVRHGETPHTVDKRFSGAGGDDPGLNETGRAQALAAAAYLSMVGGVDALLCSPMRRTRETAAAIACRAAAGAGGVRGLAGVLVRRLGRVHVRRGAAEVAGPAERVAGVDRGRAARWRVVRPGRAAGPGSARDAVLSAYPGKTVVVVTHVTPIKLMVRSVLQAPMGSIFRMELRPASVTEVHWYADGLASLRSFNVEPPLL